jgi:hypothetical protein
VKLRGGICADANDRRFDGVCHLLDVIEARHVPPASDGDDHEDQKEAAEKGRHLG